MGGESNFILRTGHALNRKGLVTNLLIIVEEGWTEEERTTKRHPELYQTVRYTQ